MARKNSKIELEHLLEVSRDRFFKEQDTARKLSLALEELKKYSGDLEGLVSERTAELREIQAKLLKSERRSLEHRITGGFAHEMRNALAGAQLEFKAVLNYREKGYSATEAIEQATTRLFDTIQSFHDKYHIPRDEIGKEVIPCIKQISHILTELSRTMEGVNKDLERGLSITNQIREYAKLQDLKPGSELVDVMALLYGYSERYERDFEANGIIFSVEGHEKVIIPADSSHIDSIFTNLINNARDALIESDVEKREIRVIAELQNSADKSKVVIKVQDNGPGIPQQHLPEIFEPFFSTKPMSGTGLGLGIVKRLVQLYGGEIRLETGKRVGCIFIISFPL